MWIGIISSLGVASVYVIMALNSYYTSRRFYREVVGELKYPLQLRSSWLAELSYRIGAIILILIGLAAPFLLQLNAPTDLRAFGQWLLIAGVPVLFGIVCWCGSRAAREQAIILSEDTITYVKSAKERITVERQNIVKFWVGINGALVLQLQGQTKRVLMPLVFENIFYINKYLSQNHTS